jgi:hypothetical protein
LIPSLLRQRVDHELEQTLAQLAEREMWSDPDMLSDTGVRHLKVEVEKLTPGGRH